MMQYSSMLAIQKRGQMLEHWGHLRYAMYDAANLYLIVNLADGTFQFTSLDLL